MNEEALFNLALEKPPQERAAFLDGTCGEDVDLRRRIEQLLKAHDNPGSFLREPILQSAGGNPGEETQALEPGAAIPADGARTQSEQVQAFLEDLAFLVPSTRPDAIGRLEHYHVLQVIGKGGFGTVLKAFDEKLHRVVAIKILAPELAASGTARQRFIREARTAAAVSHEHVVTIHAVVEEHRPPYLVMQLIDGQTLQEKLDKVGMLSLREILRIGMQMAEGLAAAHKQGLVHRDIKPANILLENGVERVKITDFGLAKIADDASVTQSGVVAGTPMYMSPEQANGDTLDHRSDLFSLGTVLYVMCTGRPPFRASGTMGVLKRVIDDTPRPVREINPEIPDWLEDIINKLHAKKPERRFQTAKEVAEVLGQRLADVQAGRAIVRAGSVSDRLTTPAKPGAETFGSPAPRRSRLARLGLITLALLGVGSTVTGAILITTPQSSLTEQGRLFGPIQLLAGLSLLAWLVFFAAGKSWLRRLAAFSAVLLGGAALVSPVVYPRLVPLPSPMAQLVVETQASNVRVEVFPLDEKDGKLDFPPQDAVGVLLDKRVPIGNWKVIAYRGDKVHFQTTFTLRGNDTKRVIIPESPTVEAPPEEPGWVQLFNGISLEGWNKAKDSVWSVENGSLKGEGKGTLSFANRSFGDFQCRIKAKSNAEGFAGVSFRSADDIGIGTVIVPGKRHSMNTGSLDLWTKVGGTRNLVDVAKAFVEPNEWFNLEITCRGKSVIVTVNGQVAASATVEQIPNRGNFHLVSSNGNVIYFAKIEIKELPPEEPGWVQLFNGKDLTGWKPHPNWRVKDGVLIGAGPMPKGSQSTFLLTERKDFDDFHLRVEVRVLSDECDSGVIFRNAEGSWQEVNISFEPKTPAEQTGSLFIKKPKLSKEKGGWISAAPGLGKPGEWMTLEVIARGPNVITKVNGKTAVETREAGGGARSGLSLQQFGPATVVHFRKIEIREFLPEPQTLDLLARIDPDKHALDPGVRKEKGVLLTPAWGGKNTRVVIPHKPTADEYDIRLVAERKGKDRHGLNLGFRMGGRWAHLAMDGGGKSAWSIERIDGKSMHDGNVTTVPGSRFPLGKKVQVDLQVRRTGVKVLCDGAEVIDWPGRPDQLSLWEKIVLPDKESLFFFSQAAFAIHKLEIKELPPMAPLPAVAPFDAKQAKDYQDAWAKNLGVDVEITNSIGMKLRLIPPGEFTMGTDPAVGQELAITLGRKGLPHEVALIREEGVPHRVRLTKPYYLGSHEVTRAQFKRFVEQTGYRTELERDGTGGWSNVERKWTRRPEHVWATPGEWPLHDDEPAVLLTAADARASCEWLSRTEGRAYALPTEAQWEFACPAGATGHIGNGDGATLGDYAWTNEFLTGWEQHHPHRVGQKLPNAFGLFDMLGNVWEHCADWYAPGPNLPDMGIDPTGPPKGLGRVLHGGAWYRHGGLFARCGARQKTLKQDGDTEASDAGVGFRVARGGTWF